MELTSGGTRNASLADYAAMQTVAIPASLAMLGLLLGGGGGITSGEVRRGLGQIRFSTLTLGFQRWVLFAKSDPPCGNTSAQEMREHEKGAVTPDHLQPGYCPWKHHYKIYKRYGTHTYYSVYNGCHN